MRIGEVNKDNYKIYQQLLGIKNTKALDNLLDDDEDKPVKIPSFEELAAAAYASGHGLEGMMVREGDTSHYISKNNKTN